MAHSYVARVSVLLPISVLSAVSGDMADERHAALREGGSSLQAGGSTLVPFVK